jgi:hypothetical protein
MSPGTENIDKLSVAEYVNLFPADRRNEIRRQVDMFLKKHGKYPKVKFHSVLVQLEEKMTSRQRRLLKEDAGICNNCNVGRHDKCKQVIAGKDMGPIHCTCYCTGDTSLGNILYKEPIPRDVRDEFRQKFPEHGRQDPLGHIFK